MKIVVIPLQRFLSLLSVTLINLACFAAFSPCLASAESYSQADLDLQAIILQLGEIRKELKILRAEIGQIRKEVLQNRLSNTSPPPSPVPEKVDVALGDGHILGDSTAKVGIVEFTDFQCPFCKRYHVQAFAQIKEVYIETGKIRYVVRDFPLGFHNQAKSAAVAARCAGQQGKYWAMLHELFVAQERLASDLYPELAKTLELKVDDFLVCFNDPKELNQVEADLTYGESIGVRGTPNFFIGRIQDGKLMQAKSISGALPFINFQEAIDAFLQ